MKNILITGGGGFVGSYLCDAELKNGNRVTSIDIVDPWRVKKLLENKNFRYIQKDILGYEVLEELISDCDMVYHFAAIADPSRYCDDPAYVLRLDLEGAQLAIKLAYRHKKKIIFSSTSEIYGKNINVPWVEGDDRVLGSTETSRWIYSTSKATAEHYCHAYHQKGLQFVILRFFNFYGPKLDTLGSGRVIPCFLESLKHNSPITVVRPGTQTRSFTYIDDGIDCIIRAAHADIAANNTFNIGSDYEISIYELASLMREISGAKSEITLIESMEKYGPGYDDIMKRVPNCGKAKRLLGWEATTSLFEGLRRTVDGIEEYEK